MVHVNFNQKVAKLLALTTVSFGLFSFSIAGGDSYSIYLNNKLVFTQHVSQPSAVNKLQLNQANYNDQLVVRYSHCGKVGNGKRIEIRNEEKKVVKEWKFPNSSNGSMSIAVREILNLQKNSSTLTLHYFSSEHLPKGRMLASISLEKNNSVAP